MNRPLVVLDTSVLVLLLTKKQDDSKEEIQAELRREAVRDAIAQLQSKHRFGIPSVVIAELGRANSPQAELEKLVKVLGRFRILCLTRDAGIAAAKIAKTALSKRPKGAERGAVKFDTLICGTAHAYQAECILTENPRDFAACLKTINSPVEVKVPSEPPATGQLHLVHQKPKK